MARKSGGQIWLEYAAVRLIFGVIGILPRRPALAICRLISSIAYLVLGSLRRVGMRNLEIAFPEKSELERAEIIKGTFQRLGRARVETSHFGKMTPADVERLFRLDLDDESRELY